MKPNKRTVNAVAAFIFITVAGPVLMGWRFGLVMLIWVVRDFSSVSVAVALFYLPLWTLFLGGAASATVGACAAISIAMVGTIRVWAWALGLVLVTVGTAWILGKGGASSFNDRYAA